MKKGLPGYLAIAFVWFSSHFGGGFASGRQLVTFYLAHQWTAIFMPALSMLICALALYSALAICNRYQVFDYSSMSEKLYGRLSFIGKPLFEIVFNILLLVATAVAFATGGATVTKLLHTPYVINSVVIAVIIFFLTIFGSELVRKSATIVSVLLIVMMFVIYLPNIIYFFPKIVANFQGIKSGAIVTNADPNIWDTLWWSLKYASLQACCIGAYVVHANAEPDLRGLKKAAFVGFLINTAIMYLGFFGILAFVGDGVLKDAVPSLFVVMHGVGGYAFTVIISITIFLGAVSTGVNLVYGTITRLVNMFSKGATGEELKQKERKYSIISSVVLVVLCWSIAQFGLIPLIAKGYGSLGWIGLWVIVLPLLLRLFGIWKFSDKVEGAAYAK